MTFECISAMSRILSWTSNSFRICKIIDLKKKKTINMAYNDKGPNSRETTKKEKISNIPKGEAISSRIMSLTVW